METFVCATCARSVNERECPFCVPKRGSGLLRAGYAVVAAIGVNACGTSACAYMGPLEGPPANDEPDTAVPQLAFDADASVPPIDASAGDGDATDASDATPDAPLDAVLDASDSD